MRTHRVGLRIALSVVATFVVLAALGAGAYFVGHSNGEDLAAAREAGTSAGLKSGEHRGEHRGYERGFANGRAKSFSRAYAAAFRDEYAKAFRRIGVPPPLHVNVPDVQPTTSRGG